MSTRASPRPAVPPLAVDTVSRKPRQGRSKASLERMLSAARTLMIERGHEDFTLQEGSKAGNVSMSLNFSEDKEQKRVWDRLAAGGTITMPLEQTFFGKFGMITDKFGVAWMLHFNTAPAK